MTRRPGLSLTEVLVALFIMGIGTIAVLTLFPLGALNMAQALRDDRTTQSSAQAGAFFRWYWQTQFSSPPGATPGNTALDQEPFFIGLTNPAAIPGLAPGEGAGFIASPGQVSYPVVVDPMGFLAPRPSGSSNRWLGDDGFGSGANAITNSHSAIPRQSLAKLLPPTPGVTAINAIPLALRTCTLLDGLGYTTTGAAATAGGSAVIDRDMRYNWLWVVQRKGQSQYEATLTVVVFDRRANQFAPRGSETAHTPVYAVADCLNRATGARIPGESRLSFTKGTEPLVQKGGWLMDATITTLDASNTVYVPPTPPPAPAPGGPPPRPGVRNANFYRVVSVTDAGATVDIELEVPLRSDTGDDSDAGSATGALRPQFRRFIALTGSAEVFVQQDSVTAK